MDEGGKARRFTVAIIETSSHIAYVGIRADKSGAYVTLRSRARITHTRRWSTPDKTTDNDFRDVRPGVYTYTRM